MRSVVEREELRVLAEEQAALRRVATLVARGVPPNEVFAAVTEEAGRLLSAEYAGLGRYESDGTMTIVAGSGRRGDEVPVGRRWSLGGKNINTLVFETGRPARIDDYADASGPLGVTAREYDVGSAVGAPVIVEGRLWGVMATYSTPDKPLSAATEARLANFTELLATAIANAERGAELARLAEEQAALRRIATLVAHGVPPEEVFAAVTEEVGRLLGTGLAGMARYSDDTVTVVATWAAEGGHGGTHPLVPGPWPLEGGDLATTISRTGRPVRIDDYHGVPGRIAAFVRDELGIGSSVGSPIIVEGRLWGALFVHAKQTHEPLPGNIESRLTGFTELVATAIANAESHAALAASRGRIVAAADETRRRIERDLHDGTQQRLVSLGLGLRAALAAVPPQLGELARELSRIADELASVFDELREIAHGIHPAILSEGGLEPALKALCRRSAVRVELDVYAEPSTRTHPSCVSNSTHTTRSCAWRSDPNLYPFGAPAGGPTVNVPPPPEAPTLSPTIATKTTTRLYGADPFEEAISVTQHIWPAALPENSPNLVPDRPRAVTLLTPDDPLTAITATPIIHFPDDAPVLYVTSSGVPANTLNEIKRLGPSGIDRYNNVQAFLVGAAANPGVENQLKSIGVKYVTVTAGSVPDLANKVDQLYGSIQNPDTGVPVMDNGMANVVIGSTDAYQYLLPATHWVAHMATGLFWVTKNSVPQATVDALKRRNGQARIYLFGGPDQISSSVASKLAQYGSVIRVTNHDNVAYNAPPTDTPEDTAIAFSKMWDSAGEMGWKITGPGHGFTLVNINDWPAAVASAPLSHLGFHAPLLFTNSATTLPTNVDAYFKSVEPTFLTTPADGPYNMTYTIGSWGKISWSEELQVEYDSEMGNRRDVALNTGGRYSDSAP